MGVPLIQEQEVADKDAYSTVMPTIPARITGHKSHRTTLASRNVGDMDMLLSPTQSVVFAVAIITEHS